MAEWLTHALQLLQRIFSPAAMRCTVTDIKLTVQTQLLMLSMQGRYHVDVAREPEEKNDDSSEPDEVLTPTIRVASV